MSLFPAPGRALQDALASLKPVATRKPVVALVKIAAFGLLWAVVMGAAHRLRKDLSFLPAVYVVGMALAWMAAAALLFARTIVPSKGDVLPDPVRAARTAAMAAAALILLGLFATIDAPGKTVFPRTFAAGWLGCTLMSLQLGAGVLVAGVFLLRRLHPVGSTRISAALGAAGGSVAGLALHFLCGYGGGLHVGLAHGGGVVIGAALGAILLPPFLRA